MFNSVIYIREICKQRRIPVSTLEKDCGFSNGYLNPKKNSKIPYERAVIIAEYLHLDIQYLMTGTAPGRKENSFSPKHERDIEKIIDAARELLLSREDLMLDGAPATPETVEFLLSAMQISVELAKKKNREKLFY